MAWSTAPERSSPPSAEAAHVPVLDGVRGLAIVLVMLTHNLVLAGYTPFDRFVRYLTGLGTTGVDVFFVLSGYLITGILLDTRGSSRYFKSFYARRVLRILPLYY